VITVRQAVASDAGAVERHLNAALSEASTYRGRHEQRAGAETVLVAEIEGCVVGSIAYTTEDESWHVVRCHVEKEFRGVGRNCLPDCDHGCGSPSPVCGVEG